MSRLFWILLSGCRGGYRYLRSVLRTLASRLAAGLTTAPGSDAGAHMQENAAALRAEPVTRSVADGRFSGRECGSLLGHMVAWLVSVGRFPARAETHLGADPCAPPAADMAGDWDCVGTLVREIGTSPGIPVASSMTEPLPLTAAPEPAQPVHMAGEMANGSRMTAAPNTGAPEHVAAEMSHRIRAQAGMGTVSRTAVRDTALPVLPALAAHMMTWSAPEWVDGKTLYIRQVYSTERDGDTLILH